MKITITLFGLSVVLVGSLTLSFAWQNTRPVIVEPAFQIPVDKLPLKTFESPDRNFTAIVCPDDKNTFIYRVNWQGNVGRRGKVPEWSVQDCFNEMWISNDGQSIAGTKLEKGILPSGYTRDTGIFAFYRNGRILGDVKLREIVGDISRMPKSGSGYRLVQDAYLTETGRLVVELADGRNLQFDLSTGKNIPLEKPEPIQANWKALQDIRRGYEFQYPDEYLINPPNLSNPLISDFLFKKEKTGWLFGASVIEARDSEERRILAGAPFENFALERIMLMYEADGADSSQYATDAVKKTAFKTRNDLNAIEFYVTVVSEVFPEDSGSSITEKRTEGPIYAVSVSRTNGSYRAIVLRLTDDSAVSNGERETLRKIVDTVKVLR